MSTDERTSQAEGGSNAQTVRFRGIDELTLVADEWNRDADTAADKPTILMLHGGGQNRFSWKNTGQVLADKDIEKALAGLSVFSETYQAAVDQIEPLFRRRHALEST